MISRWLSASDTTGMERTKDKPIPVGLKNEENHASNQGQIRKRNWHPSGMRVFFFERLSGGVASLNHRLITVVLAGQGQKSGQTYQKSLRALRHTASEKTPMQWHIRPVPL